MKPAIYKDDLFFSLLRSNAMRSCIFFTAFSILDFSQGSASCHDNSTGVLAVSRTKNSVEATRVSFTCMVLSFAELAPLVCV